MSKSKLEVKAELIRHLDTAYALRERGDPSSFIKILLLEMDLHLHLRTQVDPIVDQSEMSVVR